MSEVLGKLLIPDRFSFVGVSSDLPDTASRFHFYRLRLFSKSDHIDIFLDLLFRCDSVDISAISQAFDSHRTLATLADKKVFLQLKPSGDFGSVSKTLSVYLKYSYGDAQLILFINIETVRAVAKTLGVVIEDISLPKALYTLDLHIYHRLRMPPKSFPAKLAALPDPEIQSLLNTFLHKNIASIDMLASFILLAQDDKDRLLDNLSANVRRQVIEKIQRLTSSFRWLRQVEYIIGRNIYYSLDELKIRIRTLESMRSLKWVFERDVLNREIARKSPVDWLEEIADAGCFARLMSELDRNCFLDAMSFSDWSRTESVLQSRIAQRGMALMHEDFAYRKTLPDELRYAGLHRALRAFREIYYEPLLKDYPFEETIFRLVKNASALDLIIDETNFAETAYALKTVPAESLKPILQGVFKTIYEDIASGEIRIKKYADYRIDECRTNVLKAALILRDELKI